MNEINAFGNVKPKLMEEKMNEVIPKFNKIINVLNYLRSDLINELGLDDDKTEGWKLLDKNIKFQLGNKKKNVLDDIDFLRKNIIHSYSKTLVHFDNLNQLRELSQEHKTEMYWFVYNAQISVRLLGTLDDYLYRCIHDFNGYNLKYNSKFQSELKRKLSQKKCLSLVKALNKKDETLRLYRNDITHNFNMFGNRLLSKVKRSDGIIGYGSTKPKIESKEHFIKNFEEMIEKMNNKYLNVYNEYQKNRVF